MTDVLEELSSRLQTAAAELRAGNAEPDDTLALIEECARIATEAASQVDTQTRASIEPLPNFPGQLPLAATQ